MKTISFFSVFILAAVISGCSSGSSVATDGTTSSSAVPTMDNTSDGDGASTSGPSDDQPTTTSGMGTDGDTGGTSDDGDAGDAGDDGDGADSGGATTGDSDTANTTDGASTSSAGGNQTDGNTDATGSTDGDDSGSGTDTAGSDNTTDGHDAGGHDTDGDDTGGNDTGGETGNSEPNQPVKPDPKIDPNSALGKMQARIKKLTGRTLIALNQSLSQGEMLSAQQEQCLGTYDPAIGEPLLSIDCEQPLGTGEVAIFASIASFQDTERCRADLQKASADACTINQAEFRVNTLFFVPETGGRPQPKPGAILGYNIVQNRLTVENLTQALSGNFRCEYDLTNGNAVGGDPGGDCYRQLTRIVDLINEHLDAEH